MPQLIHTVMTSDPVTVDADAGLVDADGADPYNMPFADVASRELTVLEPDQTTDGAVSLMRDQALRRLPVVQDGRAIARRRATRAAA